MCNNLKEQIIRWALVVFLFEIRAKNEYRPPLLNIGESIIMHKCSKWGAVSFISDTHA